MQPTEMDSMRLWILMIAGGVFAGAGILLMFRAKQEGTSARLELFGQKFEASSAGIIVFLIGAAFLAAPVFVRERAAISLPASEPSRTGTATESEGPGRINLPRPADKQEAEPNQSIHAANLILVGQTVRGGFSSEDADWYTFAADSSKGSEIAITFRIYAKEGCSKYIILDKSENQVEDGLLCSFEVSSTKKFALESDQYYIRVVGKGAVYEILLKYQ